MKLKSWGELPKRKKIQYGILAVTELIVIMVLATAFVIRLTAVSADIVNQATATYIDSQDQVQSVQSNAVATQLLGDVQPPTRPTDLSASAVSSSRINLTWTASTDNIGVVGYYIYYNDNTKIGSSPTAFYSDTNLSPSTTYSYQVSAYDAAGNESVKSDIASATTLPATQQVIISNVKVSTTATTATITWITNTEATSQAKYGRTASYGSSTSLDSSLVTNHTVTIAGLNNLTTYYYQIISTADTSQATYSGKFKTKKR